MPTNDEIIEKIWGGAEAKYTRRATLLKLMDEARAEGYKEGQRETITRILMLISRGTLHSVDKAITDVIDYCKNTEEKVD